MSDGSPQTATYDQQLDRALTLRENVFITLSSVTPASSVFAIIPALVVSLGGASVFAMLLATVIGLFVGMCYAELAARYPISGGEYTWAARLLGKPAGFGLFTLALVAGTLITAFVGKNVGPLLSVLDNSFLNENVVIAVFVLATVLATIAYVLKEQIAAAVEPLWWAIGFFAVGVVWYLGFIRARRGDRWTLPDIADD